MIIKSTDTLQNNRLAQECKVRACWLKMLVIIDISTSTSGQNLNE